MSQQHAPAQSQEYTQSMTNSEATSGGAGVASQPTESTQMAGAQRSHVTAPVGGQFPTRSYLPETTRTTSIGLLNQCLADLTTVTMQLKHAHWNVKGVHFYQLHELFEDIVDDFEDHIDTVAERASALGGTALGGVQDVAQNCTIPALPRNAVDGATLLQAVADRLARFDATIGQQIEVATAYDDLDTADLLNEVSRDVSKALWFVEAHLQGPEGVQPQASTAVQPRGGTAVHGQQGGSPDSQWGETGLQ